MLRFALCVVLVGVIAGSAPAAIVQLNDGVDASGWQVQLLGAVTGVSNIDVDLPAGTVTFDVQKEYGPMEGEGEEAEFPVGLMVFHQVLPTAQTVSKIIIRQESITNSSGVPINEFRWILSPQACASFDTDSAWDVQPFNQKQWVSPYLLRAYEGAFIDGEVFSPDGALTILANLNGDIQLKEYAVPEPATLSALCLTAMALLRKRPRRIGSIMI